MNAPLRLETTGGIAHIRLARPARRNALSRDLLASFVGAVTHAPAAGARVLVVSGEGGFFSAGADFSELTGSAADASFDDAVAEATAAVMGSPLPVIAAIEGGCLGAALDLALACDLRVVAGGAFLELPALRLGLLYNPPALARMAGRLPQPTVARLLYAGDRIPATEAVAAGLATHFVQADAVASAMALARGLCALPADAVAATKGFLRACEGSAPDLAEWQRRRMALLDSAERKAAVASRKPSAD